MTDLQQTWLATAAGAAPPAVRRRPRQPDAGFTLIETMVALLVLSVGLLGIAALHAQALAASGVAINRSMAVSLAGNMADRIRANRGAGTAYAGAAADNACDAGANCSVAEMAAHDLFVWESEIEQSLPGGSGSIDVDTGANPDRYVVAVSWDEPSEDDPVRFTLEFQLQSY
jgi:type IV pilus assembly protein PilV